MSFFGKNQQDNGAPSSGSNKMVGKWKFYAKALWFLFRHSFRAAELTTRMLRDEITLIAWARELDENQRPKGDPRRQTVLGFAFVALVVQLWLAWAVATGHWTTGYGGPIKSLISAASHLRMPRLNEVVNPYLAFIFIIIALLANATLYLLYVSPKSKYQKCLTALSSVIRRRGENDKMDIEEPFYYPGRLLFLDVVDATGADLVKRDPMWAQAEFRPSLDFKQLRGNRFIFVPSAEKVSNSTMIYEQYQSWTQNVTNDQKAYHWMLGEYVDRNEMCWKDAFVDFAIMFLGTSGSGKTEAMKQFLTAFFCMHPHTRINLVDLKKTGDWDSFAPLCESGKVVKSEQEALLAIAYMESLLNDRTEYMASKGYKNIKAWSEAEGVKVAPVLLVIDEFPQITGLLKFDYYSKKDGTPANTLFKLMTKGRSFGLWVIIGTQFSNSDVIPSEVNKMIQTRVVLRLGSPGESMTWLQGSEAAANLGKDPDKRLPDGTIDKELGYGFIDSAKAKVRFFYMDDWYIKHEFLKYGVATMDGMELTSPREPGIPAQIMERLSKMREKVKPGRLSPFKRFLYRKLPKLYKPDELAEKLLSEVDKKAIMAHRLGLDTFRASYKAMQDNPRQVEKKTPLGMLWLEDETTEQYYARLAARGKDGKDGREDRSENGGGSPSPSRTAPGQKAVAEEDEDDDWATPPPTPPRLPGRPTPAPAKPVPVAPPARPGASPIKADPLLSPEQMGDAEFKKMLDERRRRRLETLEKNNKSGKSSKK